MTSDTPGLRHLRRGRGFANVDTDGRIIRQPVDLARRRALAIPPAYTDV